MPIAQKIKDSTVQEVVVSNELVLIVPSLIEHTSTCSAPEAKEIPGSHTLQTTYQGNYLGNLLPGTSSASADSWTFPRGLALSSPVDHRRRPSSNEGPFRRPELFPWSRCVWCLQLRWVSGRDLVGLGRSGAALIRSVKSITLCCRFNERFTPKRVLLSCCLRPPNRRTPASRARSGPGNGT